MLRYFTFGIGSDDGLLIPELKLLLVILSFFKLLFFIRLYEHYGFLVQMIIFCVVDLIPFIWSYLSFLYIFSICYVVLNMEIDPEVQDAQGLNYFAKMLLQTFRTSIGELSMPMYTKILEEENSYMSNINIILIWFIWCMQTFFMLVVMTNFIIAMITSTYERVSQYQRIISFQHKAVLNEECYMLLSYFTTLPEYKIVVLSTCKESTILNGDTSMEDMVYTLKKHMVKETREIMLGYKELDDNMMVVKETQEILQTQLKQRFNSLKKDQKKLNSSLIETMQQMIKKFKWSKQLNT